MNVSEATLHHLNISSEDEALEASDPLTTLNNAFNYVVDALKHGESCTWFEAARDMIVSDEFLKQLDARTKAELRTEVEIRMADIFPSEEALYAGADPWVKPTHPQMTCLMHNSFKEFFRQLGVLELMPNIGVNSQPLSKLLDAYRQPDGVVILTSPHNGFDKDAPESGATLRLLGRFTAGRVDGSICLQNADLFSEEGVTQVSSRADGSVVHDGLRMKITPGNTYVNRFIKAVVTPNGAAATLTLH